jgi:hypothetical protein
LEKVGKYLPAPNSSNLSLDIHPVKLVIWPSKISGSIGPKDTFFDLDGLDLNLDKYCPYRIFCGSMTMLE